jgi:DNA-binding response OmpR family regulator
MACKVLVVDDDAEIRDIIETLLNMRGYDVYSASDGISALAQVKNKRPNLMILDVSMPRMSGFQTCQAIRRLKGYEDIPVIFLTAKKSEQDRKFGERIGGDAYLTKPYKPEELLENVKHLLEIHPPKNDGDPDIRTDASWVD